MCQFQALAKKCGTNDPVPDLLWTLDHGKMTTIPAATTTPGTIYNTITTDVTLDAGLSAGEKWQNIQARRRSMDFILEDKGEQDANQYTEQKLTAFYPESDPEAMYKLGLTKGWTGFVAFTNGNADTILWGTLLNEVELTKATFTASKGGWDLEFMRIAPAAEGSPPFYTGTIEE